MVWFFTGFVEDFIGIHHIIHNITLRYLWKNNKTKQIYFSFELEWTTFLKYHHVESAETFDPAFGNLLNAKKGPFPLGLKRINQL